jgi:hypothetical protein
MKEGKKEGKTKTDLQSYTDGYNIEELLVASS